MDDKNKKKKNTHVNSRENFRPDMVCLFIVLIGVVKFKFRTKYLRCLHALKH